HCHLESPARHPGVPPSHVDMDPPPPTAEPPPIAELPPVAPAPLTALPPPVDPSSPALPPPVLPPPAAPVHPSPATIITAVSALIRPCSSIHNLGAYLAAYQVRRRSSL